MSILALATRTAAVIRPQALPVQGRLFRRGLEAPLGHPFADEAGTDDVVVVEARDPLPRGGQPVVAALTVQVPTADGGSTELLLTGSAWSRIGLRSRAAGGGGWTLSGVLPAQVGDQGGRAGQGLALAARRVGGHTYELAVAGPDGEWQEFACLLLSSRVAA